MSTFFPSIALILLSCSFSVQSQDKYLPLVYELDFSDPDALNHFVFSDTEAWTYHPDGALDLTGKSEYQPRVRSPRNIALLKDLVLGDFKITLDVAQTGKEYGHRDLCFFFGFRDDANFYYAHIASKADDHANNIFLVNDEPRVKIATKTTEGTDWGKQGSWHQVRIERTLSDGAIRIYFDDSDQPIMEATDLHFQEGLIGFGSFDDTGTFDNIRIWGNKVDSEVNWFR